MDHFTVLKGKALFVYDIPASVLKKGLEVELLALSRVTFLYFWDVYVARFRLTVATSRWKFRVPGTGSRP